MQKTRWARFPIKSYFSCQCISSNRLSTSVVLCKNPAAREDKPYPFISQYKQNKYRVTDTFKAPENYTWKYQPFVMIGCMTIFFIYFCILREEHDTDEWLSRSLYETVPGLEEQDLKRRIKLYQSLGKDTNVLEKRLELLLAGKS